MADNKWDAERIAELRRTVEATSAISGARGDDSAFDDAVDERVVLSLLDELERLTRERDDLREGMRVATWRHAL